MKKINVEFEPASVVYIKPLECHGRVNYVCINLNGMIYNVSYFMNGDQKDANMSEMDLESMKSSAPGNLDELRIERSRSKSGI